MDKVRVAKARTKLALSSFEHFLPLVTTQDETARKKVKWPDYDYLKVIARELQYNERTIWIPKSRRMMLTWMVTAFALWEALRHSDYHAIIQSQTEPHSKDLLRDRIKLMWENLPRWFRFFASRREPDWTALDVRFPDSDSRVKAVPQGAHQFRQYTPSLIMVDEAAHQESFKDTMTAIAPFLEKETRLILISSVAPGFFAKACLEGKMEGEKQLLYPGNADLPPERRKGIQKWRLQHGGVVLQCHYSADPNKDLAWLEMMDRETEGGIDGPVFRQEYEIEADAFSGERVYPMFHDTFPQVQPVEPVEGRRKWLVCDYGLRNPTAALGVCDLGENEHGTVYGVYRELYKKGLSIDELKHRMWIAFGPPEDYTNEWIDPTTDSIREKDTKTQYWLFNNGRNARAFQKADNSKDGRVLIREWFKQGRIIIDPSCTNLREELTKHRFEEWSTKAGERHDPKEKVVKKDDHACDALKYFANGVRYEELRDQDAVEETNDMEWILDEIARDYRGYGTVSGW